MVGSVSAGDRIVGGSTGWSIPPEASFYQTWAEKKQLFVGDKLVFLFTTGVHNVLEVTESQFQTCTHSFDSRGHFSGPSIVRLSSPGNHYFICGVGQHCDRGQKLNITVAPATSDRTLTSIHESSATPGVFLPSSFQYLLFLLLLFTSSFVYMLM
ncbi:mavicyanin-like [Aristolochia californica]|uniref:mavicyanin-like n=1 Tax=Aristolochia californica TaxID=171875 RepID=UPI0035DF7B41